MAKSGGMLNAICAKLLKTTSTSTDASTDDMYDNDTESAQADVENNNAPRYKESVITDEGQITAVFTQDFVPSIDSISSNKCVSSIRPKSLSTIPAALSTLKKNRRKNTTPRNIAQLHEDEEITKDDAEELVTDCRSTGLLHIPHNDQRGQLSSQERKLEDETYNEMTALDLSSNRDSESLTTSSSSVQIETLAAEEYTMDNTGALDLSLSKNSKSSASFSDSNASTSLQSSLPSSYMATVETDDSSNDSISAEVYNRVKSFNPMSLAPGLSVAPMRDTGMVSSDATDMKNYAQNTMNELLSLYGLGKQEAESITESISLENFSSGNILARHIPAAALAGEKLNTAPFPAQPSVVGQKTKPTQGKTSEFNEKASDITSVAPQDEEEDTYAKLADKVSKLSKLPQGKSGGNRFATSSDYVKACFNVGDKLGTNAPIASSTLLPDYSKYVKRFTTYEDCKDKLCKDMAYKEHFHCMDCNFKVFVKKEEMIRHFKWHKKREESLQHGFLRFSPLDDCTVKFGACTHNGKQTHYHCLQNGCNKVYISTSDVQMHSNYHRKDSAIIQEGFQRFRATEDCGETSCSFYGQRTTHFHCRRPACKFTFKNKADMEKHKAYHQKDEALAKDGFKKFMKYEKCNFSGCRYSNMANHIHCIRPGCDYVLHSTGQLFSHKRKHERRDFEHAYRRFKDGNRDKMASEPPKVAPTPMSAAQLLANLTPALAKLNTNMLNLSDNPKKKKVPTATLR